MDDKLHLREITSSLRFLRVANACLAISCFVLIGTSCWLIAENQSNHTSIAHIHKSYAELTESNAKLTELNTVLTEQVNALKDKHVQHGRQNEKHELIEGTEEFQKMEKISLQKREVQGHVLTTSELLEVLQGLRGPAGLPGRDGRDGRDGDDGEDGRDAVNFDAVDRHINATVQVLINKETFRIRLAANENLQIAGAVYTRWGRTVCPSTSDLVMKGFAAGTIYSATGGAAEYICLPDDPDLTSTRPTLPTAFTNISGVEYQRSVFEQGSMFDHNAPCAICQTSGRSVQKMFPAKSGCPDSTWTVEYSGFLMTERGDHHRTQYVCVDGSPEAIPGHAHNTNGALWYHVVADCTTGNGALGACPPYNSNSVFGCIVCSK